MKIAFYKATRSGLQGILNRLTRFWTSGKYSHVEIIFSDGVSASSSLIDGGVRFKNIDYNPDHWDILDLPYFMDEDRCRKWFLDHNSERYDTWNLVRFLSGRRHDGFKNKWICSEACAEALGFEESWRWCPNSLAAILKTFDAQIGNWK